MGQDEQEEVDDYMSMTISDEVPSKAESSIQRRARKRREAEQRSRPQSTAEKEAQEAAARDVALATSLDASNKGFKLLQKLGFKGGALGKEGSDARTEPVGLAMKEDRGGIGLDSEKKRKFREGVENEGKRIKMDEGDFRERLAREKEQKRLEGQVIGAMIVAERLDESNENDKTHTLKNEQPQDDPEREAAYPQSNSVKGAAKPLRSINVLWRGLAKHRLEKERERRMRYDLEQSLTRRPTYDDPTEDKYDRQAQGKDEEELEEDPDPELDEFNALEPGVRLARILEYLRNTYRYCFWCKFQYPTVDMAGCPGFDEDDH